MIEYRHSQVGKPIAIGTLLGAALATLLMATLSNATIRAAPWLVIALYAIIVLAYLLFFRLTVSVDARRLRAAFGIGLFSKKVLIDDVLATEIVPVRWLWGWGIHWTPAGWLYNVGGRRAVRLMLRAERPVMIGTDQPEALIAAIDAARAARAT